ncbi:uncharacterized protein LOC118456011 [Neolamprologus brichardi]|uniref:uncharacterized protein LOC118456011 n=1 Tax=Neolamprologus brichardi TaxID=32507 RepID=UPI001643B84F|nr:uncharacterized protein LOC118456011 [Neolamprologus brichardi]
MILAEAGFFGLGLILCLSELRVKMSPSAVVTEGQRVTLTCSTSCPLTDNTNYIWYLNSRPLTPRENQNKHLILDPVSREDAGSYSCAVKSNKDISSAPKTLTVQSITGTWTPAAAGVSAALLVLILRTVCWCVRVQHAFKCIMSEQQMWCHGMEDLARSFAGYQEGIKLELSAPKRSVDEPCSITYPREVCVQRTSYTSDNVTLTCNNSCNLTDPKTAYTWYQNRSRNIKNQHISIHITAKDKFSCAVKDHEHLQSAEVCVQDKNCWRVNYVSRRICALEGSSVNITSEYSHPDDMKPRFKCWSKKWRKDKVEVEELIEAAGRVEYQENMRNQHILTINNLKKNDSGGYTFRFKRDHEGWAQSDLPGVFLIVTELRVKLSPSAVVTEGQRVTLTCSTSCPLTDNTNYIWYLNSRPLTPTNANVPVKDKNGKLLLAQEEQNKRWAEHFQETLNQPEPTTNSKAEASQDELGVNTGRITIEEVKIAIKSLKNNKAAGLDEIPAELLKHGGQAMVEELTTLFNKCWQSGTVPEDWRRGAIVKLPKKGNTSKCTNWRGITLLSVPGKAFCAVLLRRLRSALDQHLREEQAGFRIGRSCTEQIFVLRNIIEQCVEYRQQLAINFVDFKKAFDSIHHDSLWRILRLYGVRTIFINIFRDLYLRSCC